MSLFGGSAPPWHSPHESDTSESSSTPSSPSVVEIADPHDAQEAQDVNKPTPLNADDDIDTDTQSEERDSGDEEEDEEEYARSNRFNGTSQTWLAYTEADRQIAESLEQMEDSDLSAHLYNAHALKRRLRPPVEQLAQSEYSGNKHEWLRSKENLKYKDAAGLVQNAMVPPPEWTSWPVPPTELPGRSKMLDSESAGDQADDWTITTDSKQDAGEELREELLAVFLRIAKERWNMRDEPSASDAESDPGTSRSRSRSKSAMSSRARSTSRADAKRKGSSDTRGYTTGDEIEEEQHMSKKRRGRRQQLDTPSRPVVLADDARAQQILQPSIQSTLSKLDEFALSFCQGRLHNAADDSSDDDFMSEFTTEAEWSGSDSRPLSRARSRASKSRRPKTRSSSHATGLRANSVEGQTTQDRFDLNAMDSDASSGGASDWEASNQVLHERRRSRPSSRESDHVASTIQDQKRNVRQLDWSQLLRFAAMNGWDEGAVARTAQRCANLFGESMSLRSFDESLVSKGTPKPIWYTPSATPVTTILPTPMPPASKPLLLKFKTLRCPQEDCPRHKQKFETSNRVAEHCIRIHGYDPRTTDFENEQTMLGYAGIDDFLQTAKPQRARARQGQAVKEGEKHEKAQSSSQDTSEAATSAVL